MARRNSNIQPGFDATLLARMTGQLGDRQAVEQTAGALANGLCEPLHAALQRLTGNSVIFVRNSIQLGLRSDLERSVDATSVRCAAAIRGWCQDILLATDAKFVISFAESLLGGMTDQGDATERAPTEIELDVSLVLFEQVVTALKSIVGFGDAIGTTGRPFVGGDVAADEEGPAAHAALITLDATFGDLDAQFHLLLPQTTVTKTAVSVTKTEEAADSPRQPEWAEKLREQVALSDVLLKARIRLEPLTLGALALLKPGDVLAFADEKEVEVNLDANGKDIYRCELGRSGDRYTVRLKAAKSLEADLLEFLSGRFPGGAAGSGQA
jgi:flagellar motor switch protein FliM